MESFKKTLAVLRSLSNYYQTAHWVSDGPQYYGDHLLFQRLYDAVTVEIDTVAEKAVGVTKNISIVDLKESLGMVVKILDNLNYEGIENYFRSALKLEKAFVVHCNEQATDGLNSEGVKNMYAGMADIHEGHIYLLQQRLA